MTCTVLPNFIVAGFPRTGTTWLYEVLRRHPLVFLSSRKEIHFFDRNWERGQEWYAAHFSEAGGYPRRGDITPGYIIDPLAAENMASTLPDARVIIIARNPVDRLYSDYLHHGRMYGHDSGFADLCEDAGYLATGLLSERVRRYRERFSREQLLFLCYEDSLVDPGAYIRRILEFLGLPCERIPDSLLRRRVNAAVGLRFPGAHRALHAVNRRLRRLHLSWLDHLIGQVRDLYYGSMSRPRRPPAIPSGLRARLENFYREDVAELSSITGVDFASRWTSNRGPGRDTV